MCVVVDGGGWMIFYYSILYAHFVFCPLNFIFLFPYLIKLYRVMFINIVFLLGSDSVETDVLQNYNN